MNYKQIKIDSLVNKITKKDTLFNGNYTVDPYQYCEFECKYCDSSPDDTIIVKTNADEILKKEIKNLEKGTIIIGSVHDPYQKAEEKYNITKKILQTIKEHDFPCNILTKSELVLRDIELLKKINNCRVTISIVSLNKNVSNIFEKNLPLPQKRLEMVKKLSENNIQTGLAIIPFLPYITEQELPFIIESALKHKADYVLCKPLYLKGDQKIFFLKVLEKHFPSLVEKYQKIYKNSIMPHEKYLDVFNKLYEKSFKKYSY